MKMCSTSEMSVLSCPLCCQPNFSSIDSLRTSLVSVTNRPLVCPICNEILLGLDKLTIHLFSHSLHQHHLSEEMTPKKEIISNDELNVSNRQVNKPVTESLKMVRRKRIKSVKNESDANGLTVNEAQCHICGSSFRTVELQQMHMKLVHEVSIEATEVEESGRSGARSRFECHLCAKKCKMKGLLRLHLRVVHGIFAVSSDRTPPGDSPENGYSNIVLNTSSESTVANHSPNHLSESTFTHNAFSISFPNEQQFSPKNSESKPIHSEIATMTNADAKLWDCDICAKSFTTKYFLTKHKRLHTGNWNGMRVLGGAVVCVRQ